MPLDTPTKMVESLDRLPSEVLIKIAQDCRAEDKPSTLRSLCLVSRYMESVARQELYRGITIATCPSLRRLCRTLEEKPVLGKYIVELKLLVPVDSSVNDYRHFSPTETYFELLCQQYLDVLKRSPKLRKLTMMLLDGATNGSPRKQTKVFIQELSEAIMKSQGSGSTTFVLPCLQQVRLRTDNHLQHISGRRGKWPAQPSLFKPFLLLPSLSSLESFNDSGLWVRYHHFSRPMISLAGGMEQSE